MFVGNFDSAGLGGLIINPDLDFVLSVTSRFLMPTLSGSFLWASKGSRTRLPASGSEHLSMYGEWLFQGKQYAWRGFFSGCCNV